MKRMMRSTKGEPRSVETAHKKDRSSGDVRLGGSQKRRDGLRKMGHVTQSGENEASVGKLEIKCLVLVLFVIFKGVFVVRDWPDSVV